MIDQEDNNLSKIVFDDQQPRENIVGLFGTNLFQIFNCVFVQKFCEFVAYLWLLLRINLLEICDESTVCVGILCSATGYILPSPRL